MFKKIISIMLCLSVLSVTTIFSVGAITSDEIKGKSAVLIEATTGKVLFEKESHQKRACASITKVMTLLIVMEAIESGQLDYDDILSASAHASSMGGSDIWLEEGEQMSVDDLIKATAVASANDAAVVLAEAVAGSEDAFVEKMNQRAKELNMTDTLFKNCNGLDEEGHLTSAYDVAIMSAELIKHDKIFEYTSIWLDYLRDGETQIVNTNKLLKTYTGITGLKTGTTDDAGCCMSATATRDDLTVIAVVLGCDTGTERFADCVTLMDYGFANYKIQTLEIPDTLPEYINVKNGMQSKVSLSYESSEKVILPKSSSNEISVKCKYKEELTAPVKKGDIIGKVVYYYGDDKVKSCQITADYSVKEITLNSVLKEIFNGVISL